MENELREMCEAIEMAGGRVDVWVGRERVETMVPGHTPEWALHECARRVAIDVDIEDDSEDWRVGVIERVRRTIDDVRAA